MDNIGLVFSGGGGKGAYEIGVWKYLYESGLDRYIKVISGTSVGALNAALFVGSTYEKAEELWLNITKESILSLDNLGDRLSREMRKWMRKMMFPLAFVLPDIMYYLNLINQEGIFSRDGLLDMINEGLEYEKIITSTIMCYVTCLRLPGLFNPIPYAERFKINDFSEKDVAKILLASSAIPVVFPNEKFKGNMYCDGGFSLYGDNTPVNPVYSSGIKKIIVVYLDKRKIIKSYSDATIIDIVPSEDIGGFFDGTLDFSSDNSEKRIKLGYNDAKSILGDFS